MIYTIGRSELYEITFRQATEEQPPMKLGSKTNANVRNDYEGGTVWKTKRQAQKAAARQLEDYTVYGVLADWDEDVEEKENGKGKLTYDARLVEI